MSTFEQSNITITSAIAFLYVLKLPGSSKFQICLYFLDIQTSLAESASDLSNVIY